MCVCVCVEAAAQLTDLFFFLHLVPGALSGPINPRLSNRVAPHYPAALMSSLFWRENTETV